MRSRILGHRAEGGRGWGLGLPQTERFSKWSAARPMVEKDLLTREYGGLPPGGSESDKSIAFCAGL